MAKKHVSESRAIDMLETVMDVVTTQLKDHAYQPDEETGEMVKVYTATPALLTVAIKLLKDNNITVQADDVDKKLNEVEAALADRKKRSGLAKVSYLHPEAVND